MHALRKWLLSGLLVIVPLFITLAVLKWIIDTLDQTLVVLPGAWTTWLSEHNIHFKDLSTQQSSLEDIFVALVGGAK